MNKYFTKKNNQDSYILSTGLLDLSHCHFFAVLDGHGVVGKEIVSTVESRLKQLIESELEETLVFSPDERLNLHKEYPDKKDFKKSIYNAFDKTQKEVDDMIEDARYSGTTCTSVLMFGNKLYVSNIGDSRIILVRQTKADADSIDGKGASFSVV